MGNVNEKSLYEFKLIPGIAPTAQVVDLTFKTIEVTAYNPNNIMVTAFNPDWSSHVNHKEENSFDIYSNNKSNPIRWLEYGYNQLEYGEYFTKETWDKADAMQMEIMDNFSKWLVNNEWELNYTNGNWEKLNDDIQILSFSELYQLFLKSREA